MKTAEEILFKYTGWLGNAKMVHYDDALQAMEEFASQFEQSSSEGEDQRKLWEEVEQHIIWHYQEFDIEELQTKFKISRRLSPPKSEQPQEGGQWISVKERLPDSKTRVLLFGRLAEHHESQTNTEYTGVYDEVSDMWYCLGHIVVNVT